MSSTKTEDFWNVLKEIENHKKTVREYLNKIKDMKEQDELRIKVFFENRMKHLLAIENAVRAFKTGVENPKMENLSVLFDTIKTSVKRAKEDIEEEGARLSMGVALSNNDWVSGEFSQILKDFSRWVEDLFAKISSFDFSDRDNANLKQSDEAIRKLMSDNKTAADKPSLLTGFARQLDDDKNSVNPAVAGVGESKLKQEDEGIMGWIRKSAKEVEEAAAKAGEDIKHKVEKGLHAFDYEDTLGKLRKDVQEEANKPKKPPTIR
jgi:hypothetical protein